MRRIKPSTKNVIRTYWLLGQHIVAQELTGKEHAQSCGQYLMNILEQHLTAKYGATYSRRNLYYYAQFYQLFPDYQIVNARVHNLTWTHFRALQTPPATGIPANPQIMYGLGRPDHIAYAKIGKFVQNFPIFMYAACSSR